MFTDLVTQFTIPISPRHMQKEIEGVHDYLNRFILKYVDRLQGVVVSFSNIQSIQDSGRIMYDSPYCHLKIQATFTLFNPKKGTILDGLVNKLSPDHIGLLVHGIFNASIPADQIRKKEFQWDSKEYKWSTKEGGQGDIQPGTLVRFMVKDIFKSKDMISIVGSLLNSETGVLPIGNSTNVNHPVSEVSVEVKQEDQEMKGKKKRKSDLLDSTVQMKEGDSGKKKVKLEKEKSVKKEKKKD